MQAVESQWEHGTWRSVKLSCPNFTPSPSTLERMTVIIVVYSRFQHALLMQHQLSTVNSFGITADLCRPVPISGTEHKPLFGTRVRLEQVQVLINAIELNFEAYKLRITTLDNILWSDCEPCWCLWKVRDSDHLYIIRTRMSYHSFLFGLPGINLLL